MSVDDMSWAIALARLSLDTAVNGQAAFMREYYDFPRFCEEVLALIKAAGGWESFREIKRWARSRSRGTYSMNQVLDQLVDEGRIVSERRGKSSGFALLADEEEGE